MPSNFPNYDFAFTKPPNPNMCKDGIKLSPYMCWDFPFT